MLRLQIMNRGERYGSGNPCKAKHMTLWMPHPSSLRVKYNQLPKYFCNWLGSHNHLVQKAKCCCRSLKTHSSMCFSMKQDRGKEVTVSIKYLYFKSSSAYDLNMLSHISLQYASSGSPSWTNFKRARQNSASIWIWIYVAESLVMTFLYHFLYFKGQWEGRSCLSD